MEIILLEKIQNLGDLGEVVNVKNGYARNYLIPQKKAVLATEDAKAKVEERRRQLAEEEGKRLEGAKARAELAVKEISLTRLCSEEGKLYGSVSPADIAEAMTEAGTNIEKSEVFLPEGPIKQTGEFSADVILHPEVRFAVTVSVAGEEGENPEEVADSE
ncbi:MAG: 50S ribosomal protein L9 [Pseudomonadota bacterium]